VKLQVLFLLLFSTVSFFSCDYRCRDNELKLAFVNFDSADINTILVRRYQPDNTFQNPIDTILITRNNGRYMFTLVSDTTIIFRNSSDDSLQIVSGYDWEFYLPTANKTIRISDVLIKPGKGEHGCRNPITSFNQDSNIIAPNRISTGEFWTEGYRINITK